ncbi:MAG: hypothetical protein A2Z37_17220 [Chloroflexi bacterium RBG_19FT_COMBO_62_14]|nr:MAG: hypothetical protein A2Z37_17220 [Chloroflexi bacterium RBG_19FT_COMBO_62_14]
MVYLLAIVLGFLAHGELGPGAWGRLLSTLIPFVTAWLLISPWIVGWPPPIDRSPSRLWRPALGAMYAAPLGAWLRGLWLAAPIQPVFVAVMGGVTAGLMILWRAGLMFASRRSV